MARQVITFVLDTARDRDVIRWLETQENKSAAIRAAIRGHLSRSEITLNDVYEAIQDLKRDGWAVKSESSGPEVSSDEPPDVAAALDSLGL